jgi:hypothetical protein
MALFEMEAQGVKKLILLLVAGLLGAGIFGLPAKGQTRRASRAPRTADLNRLVFPTQCRIPDNWIRYDVEGDYLYAAPEVPNHVDFQQGYRVHGFDCNDFFCSVSLAFNADVDEPGFTEVFKKEYTRLVEGDGGQILNFKQIAFNIIETDEMRWREGLPNSGKKRVFSKIRTFLVGKTRVMFTIQSVRPLGPAAEIAMRNFAGTFAISDSLGESLAAYYRERGYTVQLSHRPLQLPSSGTTF